MSVRFSLLLVALVLGVVIALVLGLVAGFLAWVAGAHPATAVLRGGTCSIGVLVMVAAILTLFWTAAGRDAS
ncbi:hypothetical protein [Actinophytocola sp.]|uniref:hypothetical protein n=1 Tax=Actinophytocola sp. TaxID=1872138 RepID=UPI003899C01E